MSKEHRYDSAPPRLGDIREVYKKLIQVEHQSERLAVELHMLRAQMLRDRELIGQLVSNTNEIIKLLLSPPGDSS